MNNPNPFSGLRFARVRPSLSHRAIFVGGCTIVFTLLWWIVAPATLYWLLLIAIGLLGWMASYGWRQALAALHDLLHQLEQR